MDVKFWRAMIRSGLTAYQAQATMGDDSMTYPTWSFHRFGKSLTELPDGRFVEIGGEHEDFYDSNFCIYNDVVVHTGDGAFTIYGYPESVFPPTDFHTATLVGRHIYIIGSLGYQDRRTVGRTPVYRLDCNTLEIEQVITTGDHPGWIHKHKARCGRALEIEVVGGNVYYGEEQWRANVSVYILSLVDMRWTRL